MPAGLAGRGPQQPVRERAGGDLIRLIRRGTKRPAAE